MTRQISWIAGMTVILWSCGGGDAGEESAPPVERQAAMSEAPAMSESGGFTRESFVLCPTLEGHREELASIVGFEPDLERELSAIPGECIVHAEDIGFARVTLPPAAMRSIAMYVGGFDAEASPAPELGSDAVFIDASMQPHVVFSMGPLIIDVDAESIDTPSRETMIELARRVREILTAANS